MGRVSEFALLSAAPCAGALVVLRSVEPMPKAPLYIFVLGALGVAASAASVLYMPRLAERLPALLAQVRATAVIGATSGYIAAAFAAQRAGFAPAAYARLALALASGLFTAVRMKG